VWITQKNKNKYNRITTTSLTVALHLSALLLSYTEFQQQTTTDNYFSTGTLTKTPDSLLRSSSVMLQLTNRKTFVESIIRIFHAPMSFPIPKQQWRQYNDYISQTKPMSTHRDNDSLVEGDPTEICCRCDSAATTRKCSCQERDRQQNMTHSVGIEMSHPGAASHQCQQLIHQSTLQYPMMPAVYSSTVQYHIKSLSTSYNGEIEDWPPKFGQVDHNVFAFPKISRYNRITVCDKTKLMAF